MVRVIGLIGGGQEIHVGEVAGLAQWLHAIQGAAVALNWTVHGLQRRKACSGQPFCLIALASTELDKNSAFIGRESIASSPACSTVLA